MARQSNRARAEAGKARRQKVILGLLSPVLVIILVVQVPKLLKSQGTAAARVVEEATTTPIVGVGAPTDTTSAGPTSGPAPGNLAGDAYFVSSPGQLENLTHFASRDPFGSIPTGDQTTTDGGSTSSGGSGSGSGSGSNPGSKGGSGKGGSSNAPYLAAVISVNGLRETVHLNGTFPSAAPIFVLKSIQSKSAQIAVWGGSFSSGAKAITLKKGQKLTLENAVDGSRYVLLLISVSRQSATDTSTVTTSTGPASTQPATTTTTSTSSEPPPPVPPASTG